jgi:hypothetical protein
MGSTTARGDIAAHLGLYDSLQVGTATCEDAMGARNFIATAVSVAAFAATGHAREIGSSTYVAGWRLGAYTSDTTNKFSHCAISAPYRSGISLVFAVSNDYTWRIGWAHKSWSLVPGQTVELQMYIDGHGPYKVMAKAKDKDLVLAELASQRAHAPKGRRVQQHGGADRGSSPRDRAGRPGR